MFRLLCPRLLEQLWDSVKHLALDENEDEYGGDGLGPKVQFIVIFMMESLKQ